MSSSSRIQRTPIPRRLKALSVLLLASLILATLPIPFISVVQTTQAASPNIVISQVYAGGTSSGSVYLNDYVELFNTSAVDVPIGGWSLQYGSSTGQFASFAGNLYVFPAGTTIPAGKYLLIKLGTTGSSGASFTADLTTINLNMAAASGKVALVNNSAVLNCGATLTPCALPDSRIVDTVSWGATNNGEGGTTVNNGTGLTSAQGGVRKSNGCQDTDNNNNDFAVSTIATGLVPRTSASPAKSCVIANNPPTITAPANPITIVSQDAAPFTVSLTGNDDGSVYSWSATPGAGISSVNVTAGQGTANATYTVALQAGYNGTASFTASLSDTVNPAVTRAVNIQVNPNVVNLAPSITAPANPITTVAQDAAPFTVNLIGSDDNGIYNWSATPGAGVAGVSVSAGQGTPSATYTVTLQGGYNGTASFTASLSDGFNAPATQVVNITVTPAPPPPLDHIVISQIYGGGGNTSATYRNDYVELYNPTTGPIDIGGWTIQYASATGTAWQVQPLGGIMQPGEYYLISLASGGAVGALLPTPNVSGSINMSGTTGKVALSSGGDPLSDCPTGDPTLVDLVGYGTANCREGATNAPAPSNTTSIFRKNGGFTDTNVNGADFLTGAPVPRRTTPITEIGPYVLNVDPRSNATTAPRDASINITFTEPVNVTGNWFDITCVNTGSHNDATVAGTTSTRIITPNTNFQAGEQCTVTINKDFVSDQDLDDSLAGTDTMKANYSWSFTVATGAAPAYGPEVHLTMGNPSGAVADTQVPDNYLMEKPEYALSYNRDRGTPNWVSWHLASEWIGSLQRVDTFRPDPAVPSDWYRVLHTDYAASGFDRGHMVPNADRDPETSMPINQATFLMSNMIPQSPDNNQGPWANFENYLRTLLPANELYIVAGGAGTGGTGSNGFMNTIAGGKVTVPAQTWKVVLVLPKDAGDDVSRVTASTRTIAILMPNVQGIRTTNQNDWQNYLTTVDAVEQLTGYDFFTAVPDAVENSIESGVNGVNNRPGTENQSVTTSEDTPKTFTLTAVSANNNPLTYTIVSGPTHGTLSPGTGAERTYTPAAGFNGTDTFTFRVNDGQFNSNVSTVTINVTEVNDAPVATSDSKTAQEDAPLTFAASDLTANDNAGASDESGQTLTVNSVNATPDTHGTVALDNGQITYTPELNYNGAASFTYTVCDNGLTGGLSDTQCATGTVNLTVASVNDAPVADAGSDQTSECASAVTLTGTASDLDGDTLTFEWFEGTNSLGTGATLNPTLGAGAHVITLKVTDPSGAVGVDTVNVTVVDTTAPAIIPNGQTISLWPVNKKFSTINVSDLIASASDACDTSVNLSSVVIMNVTSDEGSASNNDIVIGGDCKSVQLRADRNGNGDGRVYTITFGVRDATGNLTTLTRQVSVPHNQGNGNNAIDSGAAYTVTSGCQ